MSAIAGMRILSATIHLLGSSILAYCIARRMNTVRVSSISDLKTLSWPRCCVMLVLIDSWLFIFGGETSCCDMIENAYQDYSWYTHTRRWNVFLFRRVQHGDILMHLAICGQQVAHLLFLDRESGWQPCPFIGFWLTRILVNKVRIVWDIVAQPRLQSPVYLLCLGVMLPVCVLYGVRVGLLTLKLSSLHFPLS